MNNVHVMQSTELVSHLEDLPVDHSTVERDQTVRRYSVSEIDRLVFQRVERSLCVVLVDSNDWDR